MDEEEAIDTRKWAALKKTRQHTEYCISVRCMEERKDRDDLSSHLFTIYNIIYSHHYCLQSLSESQNGVDMQYMNEWIF